MDNVSVDNTLEPVVFNINADSLNLIQNLLPSHYNMQINKKVIRKNPNTYILDQVIDI